MCCGSCSAAEEKLNMPEGMLKKVVKTKEEKQRDLQEVLLQLLLHIFYSRLRIALEIAKTVIFYSCYFIFFSTHRFSTSLNQFSWNFATWCGMFGNWLYPMGMFICASKNLKKKTIFTNLWTQSDFEPHHSRIHRKSWNLKQSVARRGRPYQRWWGSHHPGLRSVFALVCEQVDIWIIDITSAV